MDWHKLGKQQIAKTISAKEIGHIFDRLIAEQHLTDEERDPGAWFDFDLAFNAPDEALVSIVGSDAFQDSQQRRHAIADERRAWYADFERGWLEANPLKTWTVDIERSKLDWKSYDYDTYTETTTLIKRTTPDGELTIELTKSERESTPDKARFFVSKAKIACTPPESIRYQQRGIMGQDKDGRDIPKYVVLDDLPFVSIGWNGLAHIELEVWDQHQIIVNVTDD